MAHKIKNDFINELLTGKLKSILKHVQLDDTLNMELRGNKVVIYYRGGAIFTIIENTYALIGISKEYHKKTSLISPTITNFEEYIQKAKHIIDVYVNTEKNHLWEKDIQQQIVKENNYSSNAKDTDYYIIDIEYQDKGRFDIVAILWNSKSNIRKLSKSFTPTITIFEVKQGYSAISGKSGMVSHIKDFDIFNQSNKVDGFKDDMVAVFKQKRELGLLVDMEKYKDIKQVSQNIEFVFLLANYKNQSTALRKALNDIKDCKFVYANAMGYGLYERNIINKEKFINLFI